MNLPEKPNYSYKDLSDCIKILSAQAVETAESGHPGLPLGFSQVMTILAAQFLRFNPNDAGWFNRDRLVLSAGHGSMLLYSFYYLTGYKNFSLDDIRNFRQLGSKAAGHPEKHLFDAIETTTGPLAQGLANAVGMAIAAKKYQAKLGTKLCNYKIYVIVGDGCLMEGLAYEALSFAGHLQLDNLVVLFDDNGISIDGKTSLTISENHADKLKSMGFHTLSADGYNDEEIINAFSIGTNSKLPCFIAFKTEIGRGAKNKVGSEKAHGAPLGPEEINYLKNSLVFQANGLEIEPRILQVWRDIWLKNEEEYNRWNDLFTSAEQNIKDYIAKDGINFNIDIKEPDLPEATRVSSGRILEAIALQNDKIILGSADLAASNNLSACTYKAITKDDFSGNYLHYGVREHAMGGIMNGLLLSGFYAAGGTFFVFSDYMRPAIRLAALMKLPAIFIMTHDSIGVGEDGPTHQPIEHLASFRAMPNINIFRPADFTETKYCYEVAISIKNTPSIMVLSRQSLPQLSHTENTNPCYRGAYVISESCKPEIDITIFASGSEVALAIEIQELLQAHKLSVRVCSVICYDIFIAQGKEYIKKMQGNAQKLVAVEAAHKLGWAEIIGFNGLFFGMEQFGECGPLADLYKHFELTASSITDKILQSFED